MIIDHINLYQKQYKNIFLVQNRDSWELCPFEYNPKTDLVLTFDFGLLNSIISTGADAGYIDHLCESGEMEKYNYEAYQFFGSWYKNSNSEDIFRYKGIDISSAFRVEIWTIITYYPRILVNILKILKINYCNIYISISDKCVLKILDKLTVKYREWECDIKSKYCEYYFPVFRWMDEAIYGSSKNSNIKNRIKTKMLVVLDILFECLDSLVALFKRDKFIFIWDYFPTRRIIERLLKDGRLRVVGPNYWKNSLFSLRRIPLHGINRDLLRISNGLIKDFTNKKNAKWDIGGVNMAEIEYDEILTIVKKSLAGHIRKLDSIIQYFRNKDLRMVITVGNLGVLNCLVMNYCKKNRIPRFMIINGLLTNTYLDEAKDADYFNAYSESVRKNYFGGIKNVFCLGDARMDVYYGVHKNNIDRQCPTIAIGTSGFNNADLNSYTAVEFDFMYDVLSALQELSKRGRKFNIIIKVRLNGYTEQYSKFINEYFSCLNIKIFDDIPIKDFLLKTDYYISIYSQTLFEASCIGIPVLYYKKDTEINHAPFDGNSELVTAFNYNDLIKKIELFYENDIIYKDFLSKEVLEKYIGYLDGRNLERNLDFIYSKTLDNYNAN